MNIFTKISAYSLVTMIVLLAITFFLISCGSSRIMLNADIPESQQIEITISTEENETVTTE